MVTVVGLFFCSCIIGRSEKPLNPRLLFTVGSEFLETAQSVALKGSIEFRSEDHHDNGSFHLVLNRGDSLAFLIEGPFQIDIFRLVLIDNTAYVRGRDADLWTVVKPYERLAVPEYGIENLTPGLLGYFIFPQFYSAAGLVFDSEGMILSSEEYSFILTPSPDNKSFTLGYAEIGLSAFYSIRKDFAGGFYPSIIQVIQPEGSWEISFEIEKLILNPRVSSKIWNRN